ncbi:MAG: hypothetical protein MUO88_03545, partial [Desulfobacterales bacterium]|nr:hypothetical protein [Desulfobacterales bacterium]
PAISRTDWFSIAAIPALWNAKPIPLGSTAMEKIFISGFSACPVAPEDGTGASLMTLATAGGMGGEYKPAFMHSKAGTFNSTDDFTG